jgi:hypothetical protein
MIRTLEPFEPDGRGYLRFLGLFALWHQGASGDSLFAPLVVRNGYRQKRGDVGLFRAETRAAVQRALAR